MSISYPSILVTGFPNTGTSFIAELVVAMGFSPGDPRYLRHADGHNRFGYWEHDRLHSLAREVPQVAGFHAHVLSSHPAEIFNLSHHPVSRSVLQLCAKERVEVYKDNALPVFYTLFPSRCKVIVVKRGWGDAYRSGKYEASDNLSFDDFCEAYDSYYSLVSQMCLRRDCIQTNYDDFAIEIDREIGRIAAFVEAPKIDLSTLRHVYRPRRL